MIVEFSVKNFRSIKEMQTISFVASPLKSAPEYAEVDENNIVEVGGMRLLKTVGIYGPNSSGKSNVLRAFSLFCRAIGNSPSPEPQVVLSDSFLYQDDNQEKETFFQIVLLLDGKKFRYGLTVKKNVIMDEWLYGPASKNTVPYFIRNGSKDNIDLKEVFEESKGVPPLEHEHIPYLTHVASHKKGFAFLIWNFMHNYVISNIGIRGPISNYKFLRSFSIEKVETKSEKKQLLNFLSLFNMNYTDIGILTIQSSPFNKDQEVMVTKNFQRGDTGTAQVTLNLDVYESAGTQKLFNLAGLLLNAFNNGNTVLALDELDSNFHPALLIKLVRIFNDSKVNTGNSQLLFTTHDTNLLDPSVMRRDQFYFTEKDANDATKLYSLADLKGIRNDADFAKQYLAGYYGALPILDNYLNEKVAKDE
jgi:hypothetical protein